MTRVALLVTLALGVLAAPLAAQTQPAVKVPRIGVLYQASPSEAERRQLPFPQIFWHAMHELGGWVEGQNLAVERRSAEGHADRLPALAADLVRLGVDVILTNGTPATQAAMHATTAIPIVMAYTSFPVETGLVASLARPGGNVTGVAGTGPEIAGKRLELLREVVPGLSRVSVLWDPENPGAAVVWRQLQVEAQALGLTLSSLAVPDPARSSGSSPRSPRRALTPSMSFQTPSSGCTDKRSRTSRRRAGCRRWDRSRWWTWEA